MKHFGHRTFDLDDLPVEQGSELLSRAMLICPGAKPTNVAIADAVAMGWRRLGMITPGPSSIREVLTAATASVA